MNDNDIASIVGAEESSAMTLQNEIGRKRELLMDYYNQRNVTTKIPGQSQATTSDVADVVESILPSLMRVFAQGKQVGKFTTANPEGDDEAEQKTLYANWAFLEANPGINILHSMFKDSILQFTGTAKVWWNDSEETSITKYHRLTREQLNMLRADPDSNVTKFEETDEGINVEVENIVSYGQIKIDTIPPEEFLIAENARDFIKPRFIGQRTPKTRSELVQMGFSKDAVYDLPSHDSNVTNNESRARNYDNNQPQEANPTTVRANDTIMLGEYYMYLDMDNDGIAELWQIFYAGTKVLEKTQVDEHPYAVCVAIPMPHKAIGTCPAEQVADLQQIKSVLTQAMLNNAYAINHVRSAVNERVDMDDMLTPRAGGVVRVDGEHPIGDSIMPLVVQPQIPQILAGIEFVDGMRENRTGITRFNQGMDADSLNQTATGFKGLMGASQQREQLIALMLSTGIKVLFEKIISVAHKYQDRPTQIRVTNGVMNVDPSSWRHKMDCSVQVGIGSGDRQEKIANLNFIYQTQISQLQQGLQLSDQSKLYNTLDKLVTEVGLKDVDIYFNNPEKPEEVLQAQNEQLMQMVEQLKAQVDNPLAEAEKVAAQAKLIEAQSKAEGKATDQQITMQRHTDEMRFKYDQLETQEAVDIPGEGTNG